MRAGVQLIAYADRLGGSLPGLRRLLDGPLAGLFTGVHVLPFYLPFDGADAGFDPVDHLTVDPRLGGWDDLRRLAADRDVVADLVVNHVSDRSTAFRDVASRGDGSPYAGMFLTFDAVFPGGAREADLVRITRPRPGLPFTPVLLGGRRRLAWTTFTPHQMDLDVRHPAARAHLSAVLRRLAEAGVATVRLDAVGYAVKTAGTSCFLTPDTAAFVTDLTTEAHRLGLRVLAEVHAADRAGADAAGWVDHAYDFTLAPLLLYAVLTGDGKPLRGWLADRPGNTVTVLDTHDGIALIDAAGPGLLTPGQIDELARRVVAGSGGSAVLSSVPGGQRYQLSCTAYDAVGADDRRYLLARLVQLFTPGVPQVYYVGLLAGRNAPDRVGPGGEARELNRRSYTDREVTRALRQPVVRRLLRLVRLRSTHPAFTGSCAVDAAGPDALTIAWRAGAHRATLHARFADAAFRLSCTPHEHSDA